jgi:hypothetical protein
VSCLYFSTGKLPLIMASRDSNEPKIKLVSLELLESDYLRLNSSYLRLMNLRHSMRSKEQPNRRSSGSSGGYLCKTFEDFY